MSTFSDLSMINFFSSANILLFLSYSVGPNSRLFSFILIGVFELVVSVLSADYAFACSFTGSLSLLAMNDICLLPPFVSLIELVDTLSLLQVSASLGVISVPFLFLSPVKSRF